MGKLRLRRRPEMGESSPGNPSSTFALESSGVRFISQIHKDLLYVFQKVHVIPVDDERSQIPFGLRGQGALLVWHDSSRDVFR